MKGTFKKWMLCMLAFFMMVAPLSLQAAEETTEEFGVSFEQEYALPGETLSLDITGADVEDCTITWVKNGAVVTELANQTSYTLQDGDLQNLYEVFVSTDEGEVSTRMLISKLPVVYIDIENGEEITTKEPYRDAVIKIQSNDVYKDMGAQYEGKTEIKGRGNSTWSLPKKPYRLKLDKKSNVFGMGKNKHWVLLANYYDTSLLRNTLAYNLSGEMGSTYISSVHVDVVINGTKRGNYQLGEHIRIDEDRVPVFDWEGFGEDVAAEIADVEGLDDDTLGDMEEYLVENMGYITSGSFTFNGTTYNLADYDIEVPEITGGYAIELDEYYDEVSKFKSSLNQPLMFKGPEFVNTNKDMMDYISGYINAFEDAIQNTQDFTTTYDNQTMHYSDLFDMDALIDYWMVQELFFNEDAMKKSSYLYKEIGEKVKMGPIWDMDWSSACMGDVKHTNKWQTNHFGMNAQGQQWYKFLVQDPYYLALTQVRYHEVRDLMEEMVKDGGTIDQQQEYLAESGADNDKLWPRGSFSRDSETLQTWLKQRLEWLDAQFASAEIFMASIANISSAGLDVTMSHLDGELYADKYHDGLVGYQKDMKINVNTDDEVALFFNGKYLTSFDQDNKELVVSYEDLIMDDTNVFTFATVKENGEVDFTNSVTKTITYNESYPLSIAVSGDYKKDYPQGTRKFDATGLVVTAQMNDGTTYDATKEAIITGFNTDTVGTVTLNVAFRGASTTFDINVYKSEIPVGPEYPENLINTSAVTDIKVIDYSSECQKGGYPDEDGLATNVLDYDSNTYWHNNYRTSVGLPQYLTFDLGKPYYITDLAFLPRQNGSNGDIFTIKVYMGESADDMELVDTYTFDQDGKSLTNRTEFKRATLAEVGQFVKVEVTASGGGSLDTYATMSEIRFYGLAMEEEPSTPTVDKTALETALYNASEAYQNEAKYTVETYVPFKEAYDAAIVLKNKADATQKEVDEAVSVLENTQKALTMKPRELGALINTSKDSDVHVEDCDSYHVGEDGDKTLDYDPKTMWHSNWEGSDKLPLSVIYDLGKTYDLSDIQFLPRQDTSNNGDIFEFKLYVGNELDALAYVGTYKMETSGSGAKEALTNRSEFKRIMLEANGRYVKLSVTRSGADTEAKLNTFVSMSEIRFYGDEDGDAPVLPDIDKTALKAAIDVADTLEVTLDKYTFESVEAFDLAYSEAILIYAEKEVSQYAVNEATQALLDAIEGLEEWSFDDIDKEALLNLLDEADVVINNQTKYTEESYASFKAVYDTAILVCDSKTATQKEVDNMIITLRDAIDALEENSPVVTVDKAALNETISEVEALVEADYSRKSWSNLQTALTAAKEVVADDAATQKVVDAAVSSLEANKAALVNVVEMKEAIAAAEAKLAEADKYTDETVAELTTVYNNAVYAINSNIGYVQADADMHATNINNAISALVEKPVEPELTAPAKVENVKAKDTNYKTITLTWDASETATAYDVYRKAYDSEEFKLYKTVEDTTVTVTGVMTGKEYAFYVVAKNEAGVAEASATVAKTTTLHGKVTLDIEPVSTSTFKLSWNKIDGATRYIVYRKRNDDKMKKVLTLGADKLEYVTAEMPNGDYQFILKAGRYDSKDRVMTDASNTVEGSVEKVAPAVTLKAGTKSVKVSWKKVEGVTHYQVYRATSKDGKYTKLITTKELSYTAKSLSSGKKYFFKVRGYKTYKSGEDIKYTVYTPYSTIKYATAK